MTIETKGMKRIEAIEASALTVAAQTLEDLEIQGRNVASNMILKYGDKGCFSATGFIMGSVQAHQFALFWLLTEGYVTLTEKALASDEEQAANKAYIAKATEGKTGMNPVPEAVRTIGAYL